MPRNHKSMEHANHMRETFHPCPPDEKSVSGAKLCRLHIFSFMFCDVFRCCMFSFTYVFRATSFLCAVVLSSYASYAFANIYDYMDTLCMFMLDNSVLCRLRSSCYAVM